MKTVAEYVQSATALILLGELGVDLAQGYYIGRPAKTPILKSLPPLPNASNDASNDATNVSDIFSA